MKVYARARKPDGKLVRMSYRGDASPERARAPQPIRKEEPGGTSADTGLSWWDRWWMLSSLDQAGYQRLF